MDAVIDRAYVAVATEAAALRQRAQDHRSNRMVADFIYCLLAIGAPLRSGVS